LLIVGDGRPKILDFRQALPHKHDLGYFRYPSHPRITNKPRIKSQQSPGLFRIATRRSLPFQQTRRAIKRPHRIDVSDKLVPPNWARHLDLQVALWLLDLDAIVLAEAHEQLNSLLQHAIPVVAFREEKILVFIRRPFPEKHLAGVFPPKVRTQG
jgi:hypothetical protein